MADVKSSNQTKIILYRKDVRESYRKCNLAAIRSFSSKQFRFHEFEDLSVRNSLPLVHEKSVLKQLMRREHLGVNVQRYTLGMKPEG